MRWPHRCSTHRGGCSALVAIVDSVQFITADPTQDQVERTVAAAWLTSTALGYVLD